ncbi:MAG: tRNA (adenosine(37)-N6)-threonylcarbamoyltransferase complex ATPase subunit type 1 TsaE [Uliginosibacterium sp.]|jgi:tRNA threonylcarbamoyladenosine biosynthesis protein TsaE|nr:tRNA (adenosine(37)-N6)-threonylcarbamoyltransferase complex ATPase subunit type 1 TsaE [Uliginosibacterium sp.]
MSVLHHSADHSAFSEPIHLADARATESIGAALAAVLSPGLVIWLSGDLGAGKTTLSRGLLRALGHAGSVKSPTYTLVEPYTISRFSLYHFDFYRFNSAEEFLDAGLDEYFGADGICLVEWADKALPYIPPPDLELHLALHESGRVLQCFARSEKGDTCLKRLHLPL